ncbi:MAG TPA: DUF3341 domain-containing protein [Kofleriaceae bacterium]|nr:DUF3341 domain-containing protein [Kofleriaceae bacterium]
MTARRPASREAMPVVMAELATGPALIAAIRALAAEGVAPPRYQLDAFTPHDVAGIDDLLGVRRSRLPWIALAVGLAAGSGAYLLQWWINVVDYPLNIGGRPYHSAPAFLPITFEMTVLFAAAAALISALVLGGLPRLWHPVFELDGFERASRDRFWLAIDPARPGGPPLPRARVLAALEAAGALRIVWSGDLEGDGDGDGDGDARPGGGQPS